MLAAAYNALIDSTCLDHNVFKLVHIVKLSIRLKDIVCLVMMGTTLTNLDNVSLMLDLGIGIGIRMRHDYSYLLIFLFDVLVNISR